MTLSDSAAVKRAKLRFDQNRSLFYIFVCKQIREAMDCSVSLCRLLKNTACCDALRAFPEAEIRQRALLHKWPGPHRFKIYSINVSNACLRTATVLISYELSSVTVTIPSHKLMGDKTRFKMFIERLWMQLLKVWLWSWIIF